MITIFGNGTNLKDHLRARIAFLLHKVIRNHIGYGLPCDSFVHHMTLLFFVKLRHRQVVSVSVKALSIYIALVTLLEPRSPSTWRRQFFGLCKQLVHEIGFEASKDLYAQLVDATFLATRGNLNFSEKYLSLYMNTREFKL